MKTAIFVDGGYLEKDTKKEFSPDECNTIRIDFKKLSNELAGGKEILRTYYYDCLPYQSNPPTQEEKDRFSNKERYFNTLNNLPRYCVRLGGVACTTEKATGKKKIIQKRIDVLLSVDMVGIAATRQVSDVVLLTGDSDFVPAIEKVKEFGVNVILYHSRTYHRELWQVCDDRIKINQDFINKIKT